MAGLDKTADQLPRGKIVGTVEIVDCRPHAVHGYRYTLANPKRLRTHMKATTHPSPIFWRPKFEALQTPDRQASKPKS